MGRAREISQQIALQRFIPAPNVASTGYCLTNPGKSYVIYRPDGNKTNVTIQCPPGNYNVTWLDATTGKQLSRMNITRKKQPLTLSSPATGALLLFLEHK